MQKIAKITKNKANKKGIHISISNHITPHKLIITKKAPKLVLFFKQIKIMLNLSFFYCLYNSTGNFIWITI